MTLGEEEELYFVNFLEWNFSTDFIDPCLGDLVTQGYGVGEICCYFIFCCLSCSSLTISARLGTLGTVLISCLVSMSEEDSFSVWEA